MTSNASPDPNNAEKLKSIPINQFFSQEGKELSSGGPSKPLSTKEYTRSTLAKRLVWGYGIIVSLVFANIFMDESFLFVLLRSTSSSAIQPPALPSATPSSPQPPTPSSLDQQEAWQKMIQEERERQDDNAKELMTLILTSATGLLGTALGFYFSSRERD